MNEQAMIPPCLMFLMGKGPWWAEAMIKQKKLWMNTGKFKGDMPPVLMPMKGNQLLAYAIAPELDRTIGLDGARLMRQAMDMDTMVLVQDGHMPINNYAKEFSDKVERGDYVHGEMQRMCDDEGACVEKKLTDCLIVQRVTATGGSMMQVITYDYRGDKGKVEVEWTPQHDFAAGMLYTGDDRAEIGGFQSESLHAIMASPPLWDDPNYAGFKRLMVKMGLIPAEKANEPTSKADVRRAAFQYLRSVGFQLWDFTDAPINMDRRK